MALGGCVQIASSACSGTCIVALQEEEVSEAQKRFQMEKAGGNYGMGTKEMQVALLDWSAHDL
jgi:hypothetical protein